MKSMRLLFLSFIISLTCLSSCKDDKDDDDTQVTPAPQASFTQDKEIFLEEESNKIVNFTNTSTNAVRYEWNFGTGQTSTISNPTATFTNKGTYTVTLTAYDNENRSSSTTSTVKVGSLYYTKVKFIQVPFTWSNGTPWDVTPPFDPSNPFNPTSNYPDVFASFFDTGTEVTEDLTPNMLPLIKSLNTERKIGLNTGSWFILGDSDNGYYDNMGEWTTEDHLILNNWNRTEGELSYKPLPKNSNQIANVELIYQFLVK